MPSGIYKRKLTLHELPEQYQQIKHKVVDGASNYIILEDKRIWSKRKNGFLKPCDMHGVDAVCIKLDNGKHKTSTVDSLHRMAFVTMPQIEGVQHKPMKGYQNLYQIYSNGLIWSKRQNLPLSICHTRQGYDLVCLEDQNKKLKTGYIYRLVYQNFVSPIPEGHQLHHINGDHRDNSIENLQLVTREIHRKYHYSLKKGVKMSEQKYIKINKIN